MKKISFITALFGTAVLMTGCKNVENIPAVKADNSFSSVSTTETTSAASLTSVVSETTFPISSSITEVTIESAVTETAAKADREKNIPSAYSEMISELAGGLCAVLP